jgi:hypothetical protein
MNMTTSSEIRLRGPLRASDLFSLEQYARQRGDFRQRVLGHKKFRTVAVGQPARTPRRPPTGRCAP